MNMFKENSANSIKEYINQVPDERKEAIVFLNDLILKTVPQLKPFFASNMLGYGNFKYLNYKNEVLDWPIVALANQKNYISIYVCAIDGDDYLAEKFKKELGKVSVGKSCIRIKKLEDISLPTLKKVLKLAAKSPGLVGAKPVPEDQL